MHYFFGSFVSVSTFAQDGNNFSDDAFVGKKFKGSITGLYVQKFERPYKNWWYGALIKYDDYGSREVYIYPEGKEPNFFGVLGINCSSRSASWTFASNTFEKITENEGLIRELVPKEVVRNAIKHFCSK